MSKCPTVVKIQIVQSQIDMKFWRWAAAETILGFKGALCINSFVLAGNI